MMTLPDPIPNPTLRSQVLHLDIYFVNAKFEIHINLLTKVFYMTMSCKLIRPPDIVCRRTYILPVFLSFFLLSFFFSPPNLRGR